MTAAPAAGEEAPWSGVPLRVYVGTVMHARMRPLLHRFTARVFALGIDLDALAAAEGCARLFSVNRFNVVSFFERDHGDERPAGQSLAAWARGAFAQAGVAEAIARIVLLCYPRVFGTVFNPIAVYHAFGADDRLVGVAYEVRNTFGERHTYVAPVAAGERSEAGLRQSRDKRFFVSPFLPVAGTYHFRLRAPGERACLRILETDHDGPILAATFQGTGTPLCDRALLAALVRVPLLTLTVVGGIHWQAFKLWLKGVALFDRPPPPAPAHRAAPLSPLKAEK